MYSRIVRKIALICGVFILSMTAYVGVSVGEEKLLQNYVKERGYNYCTIQFAPLSHDAMQYTGLWSPDSVPIRR